MRIAITQVEQFFDWMRGNPDPSSARRVVKKIVSQGVLVGDFSRNDIAKEIANITDPKSLGILEALSTSALIARTTERADSEKPFRRASYMNFSDLIESEEWETLYKTRTGFIPAGKTRDEEFVRVMGRTFGLPEGHLELSDKFLGEKISKNEPIINWILSRLQLRNVKKLVLITKAPSDWGLRKRAPLEKFLTVLDQLVVNSGFSGQVVIELYHEFNHDRYWAYQFTEGLLPFTNGHGIDAFKYERLQEPTNLYEVEQDLWFQIRLQLSARTELENYVPQQLVRSKIRMQVPKVWDLSNTE